MDIMQIKNGYIKMENKLDFEFTATQKIIKIIGFIDSFFVKGIFLFFLKI